MKTVAYENEERRRVVGVVVASVGVGCVCVVDDRGEHWLVSEDRAKRFRPVTLSELAMVLEAIRHANAFERERGE